MRMESPEPEPDRRLAWLAALAFFALGVYAGGGLFRRQELPPARLAWRGGGTPLALPPAPPAPNDPMGYAEFMSVFGALAQDPAGKPFAQAFLREPRLDALWRRFQKDRNVPRLIGDLKDSEAFTELLVAHGKKPGFQRLVEKALAGAPEVVRLLRQRTGAGTGNADAAPPIGAGPVVPSPAQSRFFHRPGELARPVAETAGTPTGGFGLDPAAPAGAPADSKLVLAGGAGDAHEVTVKLAGPVDAKSETMARLTQVYPWLSALSPSERTGILENTKTDGMWGSCFRLGIYERCRDACAASGGTCLPKSGWQACLEMTNNDPAACIPLCSAQPGCSPPAPATPATDAPGATDDKPPCTGLYGCPNAYCDNRGGVFCCFSNDGNLLSGNAAACGGSVDKINRDDGVLGGACPLTQAQHDALAAGSWRPTRFSTATEKDPPRCR